MLSLDIYYHATLAVAPAAAGEAAEGVDLCAVIIVIILSTFQLPAPLPPTDTVMGNS